MGTKNNPGAFDCYEAAAPDEPMFTLLARDPLAPFVIQIWAKLRTGDLAGARRTLETVADLYLDRYAAATAADPRAEAGKIAEAFVCAVDMLEYSVKHHRDKVHPRVQEAYADADGRKVALNPLMAHPYGEQPTGRVPTMRVCTTCRGTGLARGGMCGSCGGTGGETGDAISHTKVG